MDVYKQSRHRIIDITCMASIPPNLINRDDTGRPKSVYFGGVLRLSPASQSDKRVTRRGSILGNYCSRSTRLPEEIISGMTVEAADKDALLLCVRQTLFNKNAGKKKKAFNVKDWLGASTGAVSSEVEESEESEDSEASEEVDGSEAVKDKGTAGLILYSKAEQTWLTQFFQELYDNRDDRLKVQIISKDGKGKDKDKVAEANQVKVDSLYEAIATSLGKQDPVFDNLVISTFGRMVTNTPLRGMPDGALQVSRPLGVEKLTTYAEFYTAVDDHAEKYNANNNLGHGAAFLGEREFSPGQVVLFQKHLDIDLMIENAGYTRETVSQDDVIQIALEIVKASIRYFPNASQGSFRTSPRAFYAKVRFSEGGPCFDFAPAFEVPIRPGSKSIREQAVCRLRNYNQRVEEAYAENYPCVEFVLDAIEGEDLSQTTNNVPEFLRKVESLLRSKI